MPMNRLPRSICHWQPSRACPRPMWMRRTRIAPPSPTMGIDAAQLEQMRGAGDKRRQQSAFSVGNLKALLERKAPGRNDEDDADDARTGTDRGLRPSDHSDVTTHRRISGRLVEAAPPKRSFQRLLPMVKSLDFDRRSRPFATPDRAWPGRRSDPTRRRWIALSEESGRWSGR